MAKKKKKKTPEELKEIRRANMAKARAARKLNVAKKAKKELQKKSRENYLKKPAHLDKIVREILNDETLINQMFKVQPEYWSRLPKKTGSYIIAAVMMSKAMGGDVKAADWVRKTGFGDKVSLESSDSFFAKTDFKIQVVASKQLGDGIKQVEK